MPPITAPVLIALALLGDAAALRRTAPSYLTIPAAAEHVAAADLAAAEQAVDADLLLSIAWHESRYTAGAVTREPGGLWSCGVMTPEPLRSCVPGGVLDGYRAGARHLRGWMAACRDRRLLPGADRLHCALTGYAGGFRLIAECAAGPVVVQRAGRDVDLCGTPDVFLGRAAWIRRERARGLTLTRPAPRARVGS